MTQKQVVRSIVQSQRKTQVYLGEFFLSWNAVPTLAYQGFSAVLLDIKRELESCLPGLQPENSGSKWPKTTLGALRDDRTLSWSDAVTLRDICDSFAPRLQGQKLEIDELSIVLFHCRSLERRLSTELVPLAGTRDTTGPTQPHLDEVKETMSQFSRPRLLEYWPHLQKTGNRESHYRSPFIQATLVYDLKVLPPVIHDFRKVVDQKLPGFYCWFEDESLHMTIRALA